MNQSRWLDFLDRARFARRRASRQIFVRYGLSRGRALWRRTATGRCLTTRFQFAATGEETLSACGKKVAAPFAISISTGQGSKCWPTRSRKAFSLLTTPEIPTESAY